jgi:hypothetical protein
MCALLTNRRAHNTHLGFREAGPRANTVRLPWGETQPEVQAVTSVSAFVPSAI